MPKKPPPSDPPKLRLVEPGDAKAKPKAKAKASTKGSTRGAAGMSDDIRTEIVTRLACYDDVGDVRAWLLEEHGIELSDAAVRSYRNSRPGHTAPRWTELFEATRAAFIKETLEIPVAHRAYRVKQLGDLFLKAKAMGDLPEARAALEQAAKEMGNVYTNVSKQGGMVAHVVGTIEDFTPEERRNMLADRLRAAAERIPAALPAAQTIIEG